MASKKTLPNNTYVLLQAPNNGYYWIVEGGSKRHFFLEDRGFSEIETGTQYELYSRISELEECERADIIELYCDDTHSLIQTTEECLQIILANDPGFLDNKKFL